MSPTSSLAPAGREAALIADLYWWMAGGAVVVWLAVILLTVYCVRADPERRTRRRDQVLILGGGVVVPTIVLTVLLVYGLMLIPPLTARAPADALQIHVDGEQWWWRVRYLPPGGTPVELANEIRLPVGEPVQFQLASDNVIHSFWIPSLAGKIDMVPGRTTYLALQPTATGRFRGVCAEYCGTSHALMHFDVEVMEREAFDRWLAAQAAPAQPPQTPLARRGETIFASTGCGACHTVNGTTARGVVGPDLTHVGGRLTIAAGALPNEPGAMARWLIEPAASKPDAHMPAFGMLPRDQIDALAAYLEALR